MNIKFLSVLVFAVLAATFTGCVKTGDGHSRATAVPWVQDKISARYERTVPQILTAAKAVLNRNGKLIADNSINNSFTAKVNQRDVWVSVVDIDGKVTEVTVQVRTKMGGSDIELASAISTQIALQLSSTP